MMSILWSRSFPHFVYPMQVFSFIMWLFAYLPYFSLLYSKLLESSILLIFVSPLPSEPPGQPIVKEISPQASLVAQLVKNLPAMQETPVQFQGWEDPLEKGTATHSSILACRIPWTVQSMASQRVGHYCVAFTYSCISYTAVGISYCSQDKVQ